MFSVLNSNQKLESKLVKQMWKYLYIQYRWATTSSIKLVHNPEAL